jgi:hypothetical protein
MPALVASSKAHGQNEIEKRRPHKKGTDTNQPQTAPRRPKQPQLGRARRAAVGGGVARL